MVVKEQKTIDTAEHRVLQEQDLFFLHERQEDLRVLEAELERKRHKTALFRDRWAQIYDSLTGSVAPKPSPATLAPAARNGAVGFTIFVVAPPG